MNFITKKDKVKYWLKTADQDWKVANHLFEKQDYSYALFFGHLTIEKMAHEASCVRLKDQHQNLSVILGS